MSVPETGSIVEGISDSVVYGFFSLVFGLLPMIAYFMYWYQPPDSTIHPESEEDVNNARTHLPVQVEDATQTDEGNRDARATAGAEARRRGVRTEQNITCPICLSDAEFAVETNCGHKFCGNCMITYWNHGNWLGAIRCPSCRQQVNILLSIFSEEELGTDSDAKTVVVNEINRYNRRFSGEPLSWIETIRDLPTMLRHLFREFFSVGGLVMMFRMRVLVIVFAAILYFLSPLDLIPEAAFGLLGMLDDMFVFLLLAIYISIIYRRVILERAMNQQPT